MNKKGFFQEVLGLIGNMHASTHSMIKEARSHEVTPLQHSILEYIYFSQFVSTSQVADCLNISLPNTSRELKKLFQKNLLRKESCKEDKRKFTISLSQEGLVMMDEAFTKIEKSFWEQVGSFSVEEMAELQSSMKLLNEKIFPHHEGKK